MAVSIHPAWFGPIAPLNVSSRVANENNTLETEELRWITDAQSGDRDAFARMVELYWERLYRWLYHMTRDRHQAEDLTQETFLKALGALKSFRAGTNFRAWLFRIGHNNFVNMKRLQKRVGHALPEDTPHRDLATPLEHSANRETVQLVADAVEQLPPDYRSALLLRVENELSFREIAAIMEITEETARWRVFKARQKLMQMLESETLPPGLGDAKS